MNLEEVQRSWQMQENSLDKLWKLNMRCIEMVQVQKARRKLSKLAIYKSFGIVFGIPYVLLLAAVLYGNRFTNIYFSSSVLCILLLTLVAIIAYTRNLLTIRAINYSDNIVETQKRISQLKLSGITTVRIVWLQLPFWSTWFWNSTWMFHEGINFWITAFPITLLLAFGAVWLFQNISLENSKKVWVKFLIGGPELNAVNNAMQFLDEIDEFRNG